MFSCKRSFGRLLGIFYTEFRRLKQRFVEDLSIQRSNTLFIRLSERQMKTLSFPLYSPHILLFSPLLTLFFFTEPTFLWILRNWHQACNTEENPRKANKHNNPQFIWSCNNPHLTLKKNIDLSLNLQRSDEPKQPKTRKKGESWNQGNLAIPFRDLLPYPDGFLWQLFYKPSSDPPAKLSSTLPGSHST